MRCNPLRWLWGVVLVLGLLGIAHLRGSLTGIETELKQQAQVALEKGGLNWATIEFDGRDGTLTGKASDAVEQRAANQVADNQWGVRRVRNRTEIIEEQRTYTWTASLRDSRLRLTGFVANENTRRAIVGAAKATFPQLEIDDRMRLARGASEPEAWLGAISFGLRQLSGLKPGARVELEGDSLTVAGEAETPAAYQMLKSALSNGVPPGIKITSENVVPPVAKPFVWTARLSASQLQLGGYVPSEQTRTAIAAAAQKAFAQRTIVDRMQIASGEPDDLVAAAAGALGKLARLEEGGIDLRDTEVRLSGLAAKQETVEALRGDLQSGMPQSYKVSEQIKFREATIKSVSPYTSFLAVDESGVRLTGYVPTEAARSSLLSAIRSRFGGRQVRDDLELGAGATDGWLACMMGGLQGITRFGNGQLQLVDRSLRFVAVTDDEDAADAVRAEVTTAANRSCDPQFALTVNAPAEPELNWRAVATANEVLLEGQVPDQATRSELTRAATRLFPKSRLVDHMSVSSASSKKWGKTADTGLQVLSTLRVGEARLAGQELTVSGEAPDTAVATSARQHLRDLPKGYSGRDVIRVRSDAMIWAEQEAKKQAETEARRKVEADRKQALARAEALAQAQAEEDRRRADAERQRVEAERRKAEDERRRAELAEVERRRAEEDRRAKDEAARKAADKSRTAAVTSTPPTVAPVPEDPVRATRTAPPAASTQSSTEVRPTAPTPQQQAALQPKSTERNDEEACRQVIDDAGEHGVVRFERASSDLSRQSASTLDRLAEAANACGRLIIEVEGHADAEGTPERNQSLSERRAETVAGFLIERGVPAERLKSIGYGATQPVAPNSTAHSRALNRRVEFTIKVN